MSWDTVINTMIFLVGSLTIIVAGVFFAFGRDNGHPDDIVDYDLPGLPLIYRLRLWIANRCFYRLYHEIHPNLGNSNGPQKHPNPLKGWDYIENAKQTNDEDEFEWQDNSKGN